MMVPKTYRDPGSETLATFALASLGGAIVVLIHHRRSLLGATGWRGFGCGRAGIRSGWA
jgi:hypothetical protein